MIEPGSDAVATWRMNNYQYKIYHDSIGSFEFKEKVDDIEKLLQIKDNFLGREIKVLEKVEHLTGKRTDSLWGGRPDIVLEKYDEVGKLVSILIGEAKYTQDKGYAVQGLRELLEYLALIKVSGVYVEKYDDLFEKPKKLKGALFLDFMGENAVKIVDDESIFVVMFGEEEVVLSTQVKKWNEM